MESFVLSRRTELVNEAQTHTAIECACARFKRDMEMTLEAVGDEGGVIILRQKELEPEALWRYPNTMTDYAEAACG